jgi:hypothetical protein
MLVIRREQMEVLDEAVQQAFVERVVAHLKRHQPLSVSSMADVELRDRVACGIACARRHGFTWESTLTAFVALQFVVSPRFFKQPHIEEGLMVEGIAEGDRFRHLFSRTSEKDWREAGDLGDSETWATLV